MSYCMADGRETICSGAWSVLHSEQSYSGEGGKHFLRSHELQPHKVLAFEVFPPSSPLQH